MNNNKHPFWDYLGRTVFLTLVLGIPVWGAMGWRATIEADRELARIEAEGIETTTTWKLVQAPGIKGSGTLSLVVPEDEEDETIWVYHGLIGTLFNDSYAYGPRGAEWLRKEDPKACGDGAADRPEGCLPGWFLEASIHSAEAHYYHSFRTEVPSKYTEDPKALVPAWVCPLGQEIEAPGENKDHCHGDICLRHGTDRMLYLLSKSEAAAAALPTPEEPKT
jgi:hypothetical protein